MELCKCLSRSTMKLELGFVKLVWEVGESLMEPGLRCMKSGLSEHALIGDHCCSDVCYHMLGDPDLFGGMDADLSEKDNT